MSRKYLIGIIDDSWPDDEASGDIGIISYSSIVNFTTTELNWKEESLRHFIKLLVKRALAINNVEIIGFRMIEHYLTSLEKAEIQVPNILIIDWDFSMGESHKASKYLPLVLEKKEGLDYIYIFSRSDNMTEITECLIQPEMVVPGVFIFLYDKGKKEMDQGATLEKLIDRALRKEENVEGKFFYHHKKKLQFFPSIYLDHYLDFWKIESIAGESLINEALIHSNSIVNKDFIESLFSSVPFKFYVDSHKKYLLAGSSQKFKAQFGELTEINALDALKQFSLNKIEKAFEKSIIQI